LAVNINFFWHLNCNISHFHTFIDSVNKNTETNGHRTATVLDRLRVPPTKEKMKNNDIYLSQGVSWKEFEVIARNCPHSVRYENRGPGNRVQDIQTQTRQNTSDYSLEMEQVLKFSYKEDDLTQTEDFRVKRNNERFGFSVENPSDEVYHKQASH
jgi:hypothetical protein